MSEFNDEREKCFWLAVGRRIKKARLMTELTFIQFERSYGLSRHVLSTWEHARKKISPKSLVKLCKVFREERVLVTPEWIMTGRGNPPSFIEYDTFPMGEFEK